MFTSIRESKSYSLLRAGAVQTGRRGLILVGMMVWAATAVGCGKVERVEATDAELGRVDGLLVLAGEAFSGKVVERYVDRKVKRVTEYVDGLRDGEATTWYADGTLMSVRRYGAGMKQGVHEGWWMNGTPQYVRHYADGLQVGESRTWYEDGTVATIQHYEAGREAGRQQAWTMDGRVHSNYVAVDGRRYGLAGSALCYTVKNEGEEGTAR